MFASVLFIENQIEKWRKSDQLQYTCPILSTFRINKKNKMLKGSDWYSLVKQKADGFGGEF